MITSYIKEEISNNLSLQLDFGISKTATHNFIDSFKNIKHVPR